MRNYITIDGGTTNTRVSLVCDGIIRETVKINIGAQKSIDGNKALKEAISEAIDTVLSGHSLSERNIEKILASGMITSEFGLCKLDHIEAPAGVKELSENMYETYIDDVSTLPFVFVRGVKRLSDSIYTADMMRGEETELMGVMHPSYGECLYVLPGSHSKLIHCNEEGKIVDFITLLTGEMTAVLSQNTILKDAVDLSIDELDESYLADGYRYTDEKGINAALFKVRILKNLFGATPVQVYSFYMGVILHSEIKQILDFKLQKAVIGGRKQLRNAIYTLLSEVSDMNVIPLNDDAVEASVVRGLVKVYEYQG